MFFFLKLYPHTTLTYHSSSICHYGDFMMVQWDLHYPSTDLLAQSKLFRLINETRWLYAELLNRIYSCWLIEHHYHFSNFSIIKVQIIEFPMCTNTTHLYRACPISYLTGPTICHTSTRKRLISSLQCTPSCLIFPLSWWSQHWSRLVHILQWSMSTSLNYTTALVVICL